MGFNYSLIIVSLMPPLFCLSYNYHFPILILNVLGNSFDEEFLWSGDGWDWREVWKKKQNIMLDGYWDKNSKKNAIQN